MASMKRMLDFGLPNGRSSSRFWTFFTKYAPMAKGTRMVSRVYRTWTICWRVYVYGTAPEFTSFTTMLPLHSLRKWNRRMLMPRMPLTLRISIFVSFGMGVTGSCPVCPA